jgi:hypothetical protein
MIESPLILEWQAQAVHKMIPAGLKDRFKATPRDVTRPLRAITDQKKLAQRNILAAKCRDLHAFREAVLKSGNA